MVHQNFERSSATRQQFSIWLYLITSAKTLCCWSMEINYIGGIAGPSPWHINTLDEWQTNPDLLNNGNSYWVMKNMLLSHSLDTKVYANLNNQPKQALELLEYYKYLCLRSKLRRWLFSTFSRSNTMLFFIKRQTKAFEPQQSCLLLLLSLSLFFVFFFFFFQKKKEVWTSWGLSSCPQVTNLSGWPSTITPYLCFTDTWW